MSAKQKKQQIVESEKKERNTTETSEDKTVTEEITVAIEEIIEEPKPEKVKGEIITFLDETNFLIGERQYRLVTNYREGFDSEKLGERYSEVLSRYDYIVGDWGYEQLRLKGFFREDNRRAHPEQRIDSLNDYLYEYCNFGCAYFVIERIGGKKEKSTQRRRKKKNQGRAYIDEKKAPVASSQKKSVIKKRSTNQTRTETVKPKVNTAKPKSNTNFTIRQREE